MWWLLVDGGLWWVYSCELCCDRCRTQWWSRTMRLCRFTSLLRTPTRRFALTTRLCTTSASALSSWRHRPTATLTTSSQPPCQASPRASGFQARSAVTSSLVTVLDVNCAAHWAEPSPVMTNFSVVCNNVNLRVAIAVVFRSQWLKIIK